MTRYSSIKQSDGFHLRCSGTRVPVGTQILKLVQVTLADSNPLLLTYEMAVTTVITTYNEDGLDNTILPAAGWWAML